MHFYSYKMHAGRRDRDIFFDENIIGQNRRIKILRNAYTFIGGDCHNSRAVIGLRVKVHTPSTSHQ